MRLYRVIKFSNVDTTRTTEDLELTRVEKQAILDGAIDPSTDYNRVSIIPLFDEARTVNNTSSDLDVFKTRFN